MGQNNIRQVFRRKSRVLFIRLKYVQIIIFIYVVFSS